MVRQGKVSVNSRSRKVSGTVRIRGRSVTARSSSRCVHSSSSSGAIVRELPAGLVAEVVAVDREQDPGGRRARSRLGTEPGGEVHLAAVGLDDEGLHHAGVLERGIDAGSSALLRGKAASPALEVCPRVHAAAPARSGAPAPWRSAVTPVPCGGLVHRRGRRC